MTLVLVGLLGGLITGISPCILPVLPVIFLSGGAQGARATTRGKTAATSAGRRPYLVVLGLAVSFSIFTLFGSLVLSALHLPGDLIRWLGLTVLVLLGIGLIVPRLERLLERPFSWIPQRAVSPDRGGFSFGLVLGALYVPCAGPVLAAITVAGATGDIGGRTVLLTLMFAIGTALPLLFFALAGRRVAERVQSFRKHQRAIRLASGVTMIALALALTFNLADAIQRTIPDYTASANRVLNTNTRDLAGNDSGSGSGSRSGTDYRLLDCQHSGSRTLADCGPAPEPAGISGWLNTPGGAPVTISSLRGKVVLVDFWAYSCINCQREIPHLNAWKAAYGGSGFEVIGVHSPEYAFEHVPSNIAAGAKRLGITYPVAIDNDFGTWDAYANESWPEAYLIDAAGQIRNVSIGEGDYAGEEKLIRTLLTAANPGVTLPKATDVADTTPSDRLQTPESYLGNQRSNSLGNEESYDSGTRKFALPAEIHDNLYALAGTWTIGEESITSGDGAAIRLRYHASKVYLNIGGTGTLTISQDGKATRTVKVAGVPNIYTVASGKTPDWHTLRIELSPGLSAYSFTFG